MRILINVEKSVIIVLQSLVLRRQKLIQTVRHSQPSINFCFEIFLPQKMRNRGILRNSSLSLCRRAKCLFFESSGKKENTQIFLLTAHKYCQDGGFKLKQTNELKNKTKKPASWAKMILWIIKVSPHGKMTEEKLNFTSWWWTPNLYCPPVWKFHPPVAIEYLQ